MWYYFWGSSRVNSASDDKTTVISVIGLKGTLYSPIQLENADCEFVSDAPEVATVDVGGVVSAVSTGTATVTVSYGGVSDEIEIAVE